MSIALQGISVPAKIVSHPQSMHAALARPDYTTSSLILKGDLEELKKKTFLELEQIAIQQFKSENYC